MAQAFLEPAELAILEGAAEDGVLAAAIRLRTNEFPRNRWLDPKNRYYDSVLSKIQKDTASSGKSLNESDIVEYVAASGPLHCADGWAFLGRALAAHAQGDGDVARHLAYYAELRGAMSTLACHGVGLFDDRHVVVRADGTASWLRSKSTHAMTWLVLEWWAALPSTATVLADLFRPQGISIEDWVTAMPGGSWQPVASTWLKSWGLDLSLFGSDRSARNESSYRPTRIAGRRSLGVLDAIAFLRDLWTAFEPAGTTFSQLDRNLLRRSLESIFRGTHGVPPRQKQADWEAAIDVVLDATMDEGALRDAMRAFLLRQDGSRESPLLRFAEEAGVPNQKDHHLRVISRAALLLRVASGCCARLLVNSGIAHGDISYWWVPWGEDRGLWRPGGMPWPLTALWEDIADSLDDLEDSTRADPEVASSYSAFLDACASPVLTLSSCERIALWSLAA